VIKAMDTIWSNKVPERCGECYKKIGDVFYDSKIFACEGFRQMQVCENCFERSRMLGRGEGDRYERNSTGKFVKPSK